MMPARVALALQADGWILRSAITWAKKAPMPESVRDRPTNATEMVYLLAKQPTYHYDAEAVRHPLADKTLTHRGNGKAGGHPDHQDELGMVASGNWGAWDHPRVANPAGANLRNWWLLGPEPYSVEMCLDCGTVFSGTAKRALKTRIVDGVAHRVCPHCGATDAWHSHFAVFPTALVEPCVLAGTSARGQCPACGAPWTRTTKPTAETEAVLERARQDPAWKSARRAEAVHIGNAFGSRKDRESVAYETTGWAPTCACPPAEPVSQTVLDCFAGSGTSLYVARHHGRRAVGIELNESYAALAADRLKQGTLGLEIY